MPLIEFRCESCDNLFEELVRTADKKDSVKCPDCGGKVTRQFSTFAARASGGDSGPRPGSCGQQCSTRDSCPFG